MSEYLDSEFHQSFGLLKVFSLIGCVNVFMFAIYSFMSRAEFGISCLNLKKRTVCLYFNNVIYGNFSYCVSIVTDKEYGSVAKKGG